MGSEKRHKAGAEAERHTGSRGLGLLPDRDGWPGAWAAACARSSPLPWAGLWGVGGAW